MGYFGHGVHADPGRTRYFEPMETRQGSDGPSAPPRPKRGSLRGGARDLLAAIGGSLGFDHAVEFYDETRGLSPEVQLRTARLLAAELQGATRVLEVGAGTGLVTVPLAAQGIEMVGLDISQGMLKHLTDKAQQAGVRVPILVGDATSLPLEDRSVDGVVMRHVLHLVHDWRKALAEVARVLRPSGRFAVSITDYTGLYHTLQERFLHAAGDLPIAVGLRPDDPASLDRALAEIGATRGPVHVVRGERTLTIDAFLRYMERGVYTWTWAATPHTRRRAVAEVRSWARPRLGDLHRPVENEFEIEWRIFQCGG
jgi:ubiquinone/menaquinone biosynthesis C-methylase UbiE